MARTAAKSILEEKQEPEYPIMNAQTVTELLCPVREAEDDPTDEPGAKKRRTQDSEENPKGQKRSLDEYEPFSILSGQSWTDVMDRLQSILPKSGAQVIDLTTWPGRFLCDHCQIEKVAEIKAIKGVERYMVGNPERNLRQTISLCRKTKRIVDLGVEEWTKLPQTQQRRKAIPSHIMISIFGRKTNDLDESQPKSESIKPPNISGTLPSQPRQEEQSSSSIRPAEVKPPDEHCPSDPSLTDAKLAPIPTWSPAAIINSGPKFLS